MVHRSIKKYSSAKTRLNFWDLAIIMGTSLGIPVYIIGGALTQIYGAGTTIVSIIVGNLILWAIGLGIIEMTFSGKFDAIENVKFYLGKRAALVSSFILLIAFLTWYSLQIESATLAIASHLKKYVSVSQAIQLRIGLGFGFLAAFLTMGGLRLIRKIFLICGPLLIAFIFYALITRFQPVQMGGTWGSSFSIGLGRRRRW